MSGKFLTPKRRNIRQKSGFNVSGNNNGSSCIIENTYLIQPESNKVILSGHLDKLTVVELFYQKIGIFGAGIYVYPLVNCEFEINLSWHENEKHNNLNKTGKLDGGYWQSLGLIKELEVLNQYKFINNIKFSCSLNSLDLLSIYSLLIGVLDYEYLTTHDVYKDFKKKTNLYIPEILYLDPTQDALKLLIEKGQHKGDGYPIVCKSCNRCDRFLPINITDERKTIGYSNHCVKETPCQHPSFSRYEIIGNNLNPILQNYISNNNNEIISYYGHQLECRVCKKFFVNMPLNPMRNSTQHREDSLRRRALDVLVRELLGKDWIYHEHRMNVGNEFDVYIWDKFDRKCFKCQKSLSNPREMDLDHTFPLAYLWPLDDTATCLCSSCNSSKSDKFPVDFYTQEELQILSTKTGLSLDDLNSRSINQDAVNQLFERIEWFFDDFLADSDYQKDRDGKKAADLIVNAINKVLQSSGYQENLVKLYEVKTGKLPTTISLS